jgi:hypothetical protein
VYVNPTPTGSVNVHAGLQEAATSAEEVILSATNTRGWIIANELLEFKKDRREHGGRMKFTKPYENGIAPNEGRCCSIFVVLIVPTWLEE